MICGRTSWDPQVPRPLTSRFACGELRTQPARRCSAKWATRTGSSRRRRGRRGRRGGVASGRGRRQGHPDPRRHKRRRGLRPRQHRRRLRARRRRGRAPKSTEGGAGGTRAGGAGEGGRRHGNGRLSAAVGDRGRLAARAMTEAEASAANCSAARSCASMVGASRPTMSATLTMSHTDNAPTRSALQIKLADGLDLLLRGTSHRRCVCVFNHSWLSWPAPCSRPQPSARSSSKHPTAVCAQTTVTLNDTTCP